MNENIEDEIKKETPVIRRLRPSDMDAVVRVDAKVTGRERRQYFESKLAMALAETGVEVSLAAEVDDLFVGFLLARVYYGEFGVTEDTAVLDTLNVHPDFRSKGIGRALMKQLCMNLRALNLSTLRTEVDWDSQALLHFFHERGFKPAPRVSLDLDLDAPSWGDD